jgi:hypothetical protein
MFEQTIDKTDDNSRTRTIVMASIVFLLLVGVGAFLYRAFLSHQVAPPQPGLTGAQRAGTPAFDSYAKEVVISNQEQSYSTNALGGFQIIAHGRVQNFGNKTITGLEVRAVAYDFEGKPLKERIAAPIPRTFSDPLPPNGTLPITVVINDAPDEMMVQSIKIELNGLILQ